MDKFHFFSNQYMRILEASNILTKGLEYVSYNASNYFTLQYPLILAPLQLKDTSEIIDRKIRLVAKYIDIFIARRVWNQRTLGYSAIVYTMFNLIREIRDRTIPELVDILKKEIDKIEENFTTNPNLSLNQQNRRYIHRLLARITYHVEEQSGIPTSYEKYISREIPKPFEIEHIWADKLAYHKDEFDNIYEFKEYRDHIGGLVLVPKSFNQRFGDLPYKKKVTHYLKQNLLAQSLHPNCYDRSPGFTSYFKRNGLPFKPYLEFKKGDLEERRDLYSLICNEIWSADKFKEEL